ncbi:hypothetical protein [Palleronia sp. LCG004]|uniref:hypothetical protein n=1 Tax=Palleronia sp. LCG004 TaxID=3079304 RepID=UPI0029431F39|nr:hypothetical protein [Palleronia sp. LCG004]WOI57654.1 hypothetical protein RVY76_15505 [Palleronia sp. LCG004]
MTTFAMDPASGPVQAIPGGQRFGRIEAVRTGIGDGEIEIRQPDGALLTVRLTPETVDGGMADPVIGRNVWILGRIEGAVMSATSFAVYDEEP